MVIILLCPGEGSAQEVLSITHEVNGKLCLKYLLEEIFLGLTGGVEDKIIHIQAYADGGTIGVVRRNRQR